MVPPVYHTPELVRWCAKNYDLVSKTVKSKITKKTVLNITPEALQIMLMYPTTNEMMLLHIDEFPSMYSSLSVSAKRSFWELHLLENQSLVAPPHMSEMLKPMSRIALSFISQVLGISPTGFVLTGEVLGLIAVIYNPEEASIHVFDYCTYISDNMHSKLIKFDN